MVKENLPKNSRGVELLGCLDVCQVFMVGPHNE